MDEDLAIFAPNEAHLALLDEGVAAWNAWREAHPDVKPYLYGAALDGCDLRHVNLSGAFLSTADLEAADLRGADLSNALLIETNFQHANLETADLSGANLNRADLSDAVLDHAVLAGAGLVEANLESASLVGADLHGATLAESILVSADLSGADLRGAHLSGAALGWATLQGANLTDAQCVGAALDDADFSDAVLINADLTGATLRDANMNGADLQGANLSYCSLVKTKLVRTNLARCSVFGIAAWQLTFDHTIQSDLIITEADEPVVTVDNLEVAQFVYLLLRNEKIRDLINTITSKAVLILGRFTTERKRILDAVREALRAHDYVPIVFDFTPSAKRDLTETVQLLANMSRFIIADLTDARSIPQELSHIIPNLPSVPVQPIILASQRTYAMYEHWERFHSVLPDFSYNDERHLIRHLEEKVIRPAESWEIEQTEVRALREEVKALRARLAREESAKSGSTPSDGE